MEANYTLIFKLALQIPGLFQQIGFSKITGKRVKPFTSEKMDGLTKVMMPLSPGALRSVSECAWSHIPQQPSVLLTLLGDSNFVSLF